MTFYEYKLLSSQRGWKFNKVVNDDILNIEYIHPLKQSLVVNIVKAAGRDSGVKSVRIFGSSITDNCDFSSDLDICVDWKFDCYDNEGVLVGETVDFLSAVSKITEGCCDVVHLQYLKGTDVEEAAKGGVIVYVSDVK